MATVTIENITKTFGETLAVDDVSFHIEDGEFVVLLGPSGCGKTTTLNMIAGLEKSNSGRISIGGKRVENVPPDKRDIAMVFQSIALYPHMSVYQNIVSRTSFRAASASVLRSAGLWFATLPCFCLTSRSRASTPSSGSKCG
jgi:multiple sugar transport system ATP-binding protein